MNQCTCIFETGRRLCEWPQVLLRYRLKQHLSSSISIAVGWAQYSAGPRCEDDYCYITIFTDGKLPLSLFSVVESVQMPCVLENQVSVCWTDGFLLF